jgi:hypothetical protein
MDTGRRQGDTIIIIRAPGNNGAMGITGAEEDGTDKINTDYIKNPVKY